MTETGFGAAYARLREDIARALVAEVNTEYADGAAASDTFQYDPDWAAADVIVAMLVAKGYRVYYEGTGAGEGGS